MLRKISPQKLKALYLQQEGIYEMLGDIMLDLNLIQKKPEKKTNLKANKIVELVNDIFESDVMANNQRKNTVFGRHAAAWTLKKYTNLSLSEISTLCGQTHHTTAINSIKKCNDMMETEAWYKKNMDIICRELDFYIE